VCLIGADAGAKMEFKARTKAGQAADLDTRLAQDSTAISLATALYNKRCMAFRCFMLNSMHCRAKHESQVSTRACDSSSTPRSAAEVEESTQQESSAEGSCKG
jgi:hypothetical protein